MSLSRGILVVLWSAPFSRMHGRWKLTDEQWELIEPVLRPARRADNRGRPWHDTRAVLNGVVSNNSIARRCSN
jgi:hypothetical protein